MKQLFKSVQFAILFSISNFDARIQIIEKSLSKINIIFNNTFFKEMIALPSDFTNDRDTFYRKNKT